MLGQQSLDFLGVIRSDRHEEAANKAWHFDSAAGTKICREAQEAVDVLEVPALPAGEYVLGWRWDCEATAQVWSNCADVELVA